MVKKPNDLQVEKLILNYMRWKLTDPEGRGSTTTETFNGDNSTKTFTLGNIGVKYIGSVTIGGTASNYIEDFTADLKDESNAAIITFDTAPLTGTNNISVSYGYGSTWILPFMPKVDSHMPIIGMKMITKDSTTLAMGNPGRWFEPVYQIAVYIKREEPYTISGKEYTGSELIGYLTDQISTQLLENIPDMYRCMNIKLIDAAIAPYDPERKIAAEVDTYHFKFEQRY